VTQTCPIDIAREINRRWEPRLSAVEMIVTPATGFPQTARDMRRSASRPRSTGGEGSIFVVGYAAHACGDEWVTVLRVGA
jgi:hypothetical protein